jgi:hypothetical protein
MNDQQIHEKKFNILSLQENANQNYFEHFSNSLSKWQSSRKQLAMNTGKYASEKGNLIHGWSDCILIQPL